MPPIDAQALNNTSAFMLIVEREQLQTGESRMPDMPASDAFPFASQVFLLFHALLARVFPFFKLRDLSN